METESKVISEQEGILCRDEDGWIKIYPAGTTLSKVNGIWMSSPSAHYSLCRASDLKMSFPDIDALIPPGEGPLEVVFKLEVR